MLCAQKKCGETAEFVATSEKLPKMKVLLCSDHGWAWVEMGKGEIDPIPERVRRAG